MNGSERVYKLVPVPMELNESFIDTYESFYYLDGEKRDNTPLVVGVSQTCRWIENDMEELPEKDNWSKTDVIHILAWKMGHINHKESKDKGKYILADTWSDKEEQLKATNRSGPINEIEPFVEKVLDFKTEYDKNKNYYRENRKELLEKLQALKVRGIGSVYLVTILYFVSGGEYPIFDRFAMTALNAIIHDKKNGTKPGEEVTAKGLPDNVTELFSEKRKKDNIPVYQDYIAKLEQLCEIIYGDKNRYRGREGRKIDRALWVYGHLFR